MFKIVTKTQQMRDIVERNLEEVNLLLEFSKKENLTESETNYTSQKLALEKILKEFDQLDKKIESDN